MKDFTGIFHIGTLYDKKGNPSYKAFEELSKIKDNVLLTVLTDVKSDINDRENSRIHKDFPGIFESILPVSELRMVRPMPQMAMGTFYFGGFELLKMAKLFEIRTVWYYTQETPASEVTDLMSSDCRPDFVMVAFSTLETLFSYSAKADLAHFDST
jgi:hypothetical protein